MAEAAQRGAGASTPRTSSLTPTERCLPANPNQSFQVAAESKMVLGCLVPFFAVFALVSFWFVGIFPVG